MDKSIFTMIGENTIISIIDKEKYNFSLMNKKKRQSKDIRIF